MERIGIVFKRELLSYFATPLAYVFIVILLMLSGVFTFDFGGFYQRNQADLQRFFAYHTWLSLLLVPAIAMRLWAEERKSGTIELLMTLPITLVDAAVGKFLAAWVFVGIALDLTFPIWITVNYLGEPDNGVIFATYLGSWLMAGAFMAVGSCMSAATKNQVIAFIMTVTVCFLFIATGFPMVLNNFPEFVPQVVVDTVASLSFLTHYSSISKGVLDLRDFLYFIVFIGCWLFATVVVIELKKADQ